MNKESASLQSFLEGLVFGKTLEEKLTPPKNFDFERKLKVTSIPALSARPEKLGFSTSKKKFKLPNLRVDQSDLARAKLIHSFANHELLAVEFMAATLLKLAPKDSATQNKLLHTIGDEQRHFRMYVKRLEDLGHEFGDFPLNGFIWHKIHQVESWDHYWAIMALTFEQANLDFAHFFREEFKLIGDEATASVLNTVYEEEISHVSFGARHFGERQWERYSESLMPPLTPARAKGQIFDEKARARSGLSTHFIHQLKNYQSDFSVTQRRQWK